ncbi:hypothetical protein FRC12_003429 [Ceratobasidium sp. 428]|nr:hypothetical protein FRC12_003429 [Ceratobasidium sp. 428]
MFNHLHRIEHSFRAIHCFRIALSLLPSDSPEISLYLSNLGSLFALRFRAFGNTEDGHEALTHLTKAMRLDFDQNPDRTRRLICLGELYLELFLQSDYAQRSIVIPTIKCFYAAAHVVAGRPSLWLYAARRWVLLVRPLSLELALKAYAYCMMLLPQVVWIGTSVTDQHACVAREVRDMVAEATSVAISLKKYDLALEWLEQGRSIAWGQLLQLRTPFDELSARCPELADALLQISRELESTLMSHLPEQLPPEAGSLCSDMSLRQRRLAERREELLQSIRGLPGFSDFLLPAKVQKLAGLVNTGVTVVVNVSDTQCDALIIRSWAPGISHVSLPAFSLWKAKDAHLELEFCIVAQRSRRGVKRSQCKPDFKHVLLLLWCDVVKPVLDHLTIKYDPLCKDLPHITWCVSGPLSFLPLHAAGDYDHPSTVLPNIAISSYTPTITSLAQESSSPHAFSGLLMVGHESSIRNLNPLPGAKAELDQIASHARAIRITRIEEESACADAVLQGMADHSWVHFACHGSQNKLEPMKSALHLHDKDLDLLTIARTRLENAQFAFLSACQTATGDAALPDESIHLAAGLLMAGYPTVIATMWSISDADAPLVAGKVYESLLENGVPNSRKAAKALHKAVASLRESIGVDEFARWVPYIHIGR